MQPANHLPWQDRLRLRLIARRLRQHERQQRIVCGPQQVRLTIDGQSLISFCSNDYLGLANHPKVREALTCGVRRYGVGSGASHWITGHSQAHQQLAQALATFTGYEKVMLFGTGYMANIGVLTTLADRHDLIFQDRLNHASLLDGAAQSLARSIRYRHKDVVDLRRRMLQHPGKRGLVVSDGVFSMEGDMAPLAELAMLSSSSDYLLMIDDAHGFGVHGDQGRGSVQAAELDQVQVPVYMATLGKALGTLGAFVAGDRDLIDYLMQFSRSYIYTTALPGALAEATLASLKLVQEDEPRRQRLHNNIDYFRQGAAQRGVVLGNFATAIQAIKVPSVQQALRLQTAIEQAGYVVIAIRPPTVPSPCLRVTLCSEHNHTQIDGLLDVIAREMQGLDQNA